MPPIEIQDLNDYAVLWAAGVPDGYGRYKVLAPEEIHVRWEDSLMESTDPQNTIQSQPSQIFVDKEITVGSILWHGRLEVLRSSPTNLMKVTGYDATPDLKNRFIQRTVTLIRYGDSLPDIATNLVLV